MQQFMPRSRTIHQQQEQEQARPAGRNAIGLLTGSVAQIHQSIILVQLIKLAGSGEIIFVGGVERLKSVVWTKAVLHDQLYDS